MTWRSLSLALLMAPLALTGCPPDSPDDSDEDTTDVDTSDPGTDDPDTDPGTDAPSANCHELPSNLPAFGGAIDPTLVTDSPFTMDAGLGAVMTAAEAATDDSATVDLDVDGAIVTTLDFNRDYEDTGLAQWFYVADASGAMFVRLDFDETDGFAVSPGDEVDFTVTSVRNFSGTLQIDAISSLTVVSSDNPVHVVEGNGIALDTDNDVSVVHHLYGELVSSGSECGSSECFDLETRNGEDSTTTTFRIRNDRLTTPYIEGDCVDLYAPLGVFSGSSQFNINNFQWVRWIANVND